MAVAILSAVAIGGFSVMNKGVGIASLVLERTEVRSQVSAQMELLSYVRDQYSLAVAAGTPTTVYPASLWETIRTSRTPSTNPNTTAPTNCTPTAGSAPFFIEKDTATGQYKISSWVSNATTTTPTPGRGLWIEAVASPASVSVSYVDFYVKACWDSVAGDNQQVISSTARLYDNR